MRKMISTLTWDTGFSGICMFRYKQNATIYCITGYSHVKAFELIHGGIFTSPPFFVAPPGKGIW